MLVFGLGGPAHENTVFRAVFRFVRQHGCLAKIETGLLGVTVTIDQPNGGVGGFDREGGMYLNVVFRHREGIEINRYFGTRVTGFVHGPTVEHIPVVRFGFQGDDCAGDGTRCTGCILSAFGYTVLVRQTDRVGRARHGFVGSGGRSSLIERQRAARGSGIAGKTIVSVIAQISIFVACFVGFVDKIMHCMSGSGPLGFVVGDIGKELCFVICSGTGCIFLRLGIVNSPITSAEGNVPNDRIFGSGDLVVRRRYHVVLQTAALHFGFHRFVAIVDNIVAVFERIGE